MTRFYRWLLAHIEQESLAGEVARWAEERPEITTLRESEDITMISSHLFGKRVVLLIRKKVRAVHRQWRQQQLAEKFGEWPIRSHVPEGAKPWPKRKEETKRTESYTEWVKRLRAEARAAGVKAGKSRG